MGLGQDFSVVLDSFRISLYLGVCTSIVKHRSDSYCPSFISNVDKKIVRKIVNLLRSGIKNFFKSLEKQTVRDGSQINPTLLLPAN